MKIWSIRIGYETNSSSSHSFVLLLEPRKTDTDKAVMKYYGWGPELLTTPEEIAGYVLTQALENDKEIFQTVLGDILYNEFLKEVKIEDAPEIDHASIWELKGSKYSALPNFYRDFLKWLLKQEEIGIAVDNDNEPEYDTLPEPKGFPQILYRRRVFVSEPGNYYLLLCKGWEGEVARYRVSFKDEPLKAEYPESIDVKITEMCNNNCWYCFENVSPNGRHCSFEVFTKLISEIGGKTLEIAIGGGNPLKHPQFMDMIRYAKEHGVIPNFTVNIRDWSEFMRNVPLEKLKLFEDLGIGLSWIGVGWHLDEILALTQASNWILNYTIHIINCVHGIEDIKRILEVWYKHRKDKPKILVLGFKEPREKNFPRPLLKEPLKFEDLQKHSGKAIFLFDNLAVEQLGVRDYVPPETWKLFYQGADGQYTMFVDLVNMQYAKNSYSARRYKITTWGEMFERFRRWK